MSEILKPSKMNVLWASGGDILDPGDTKYATGWSVEIPPRQWENFVQNKQDSFNAHVNQHGVPTWDAETEYQANKSYVQGKTNGTIYRCILTHTNQDPELDVTNTYWIIAFASAGDFYTKTETDGLYLAKTQNLADLTNTATARTNLSVYSQAETYTQAQVDAKTTVASTAQSQAWTSNTTLLTPLRLSEAFKGSNQTLSSTGKQLLPGGLLMQWGEVVASDSAPVAVVFATPFSATPYSVQLTAGSLAAATATSEARSLTGFSINRWDSSGTRQSGNVQWLVIGPA